MEVLRKKVNEAGGASSDAKRLCAKMTKTLRENEEGVAEARNKLAESEKDAASVKDQLKIVRKSKERLADENGKLKVQIAAGGGQQEPAGATPCCNGRGCHTTQRAESKSKKLKAQVAQLQKQLDEALHEQARLAPGDASSLESSVISTKKDPPAEAQGQSGGGVKVEQEEEEEEEEEEVVVKERSRTGTPSSEEQADSSMGTSRSTSSYSIGGEASIESAREHAREVVQGAHGGEVRGVVTGILDAGSGMKLVEFDLTASPRSLSFLPGQYAKMSLEGYSEGVFSFASSPEELPIVRFAVSDSPNPKSMRRWLTSHARRGDAVVLSPRGCGSLGVVPGMIGSSDRVCLIGGGGSISPLISILDHLYSARKEGGGHAGAVDFIHSARTPEEIPFRSHLAQLASAHSSLAVTHTVTRPQTSEEGSHWKGLTGRLHPKHLRVASQTATLFYVSGSGGFVKAVVEMLLQLGVWAPRIRSDYAPGAWEAAIQPTTTTATATAATEVSAKSAQNEQVRERSDTSAEGFGAGGAGGEAGWAAQVITRRRCSSPGGGAV